MPHHELHNRIRCDSTETSAQHVSKVVDREVRYPALLSVAFQVIFTVEMSWPGKRGLGNNAFMGHNRRTAHHCWNFSLEMVVNRRR
jgi:hypothetical protein